MSQRFDWLVTVDPHLHRWSALEQVYDIPTTLVPAELAMIAYSRPLGAVYPQQSLPFEIPGPSSGRVTQERSVTPEASKL